MKYNVKVVLAYFKECKLPSPEVEFKFHPERRWKLDFAWPVGHPGAIEGGVYLEVDGGIFSHGSHTRGARMLKTWERDNEATCRGWRGLRCQPRDLCTQATVDLIKRALAM